MALESILAITILFGLFSLDPVIGKSTVDKKLIAWRDNMTATEVVEHLMQFYDKRDPPNPNGTTIVKIGIYIKSFDSISEQSMDYAINFYLRQNWTEPRLKIPENYSLDEIKLENGMWDQLWIPDVFFRNEKKASFHHITVPNRLMRLDKSGNIWYVSKITAVLSCPMNLQKYPLDTQQCPLMFESFGFTTKTVDFDFLPDGKAFQKEGNLTIPQFQLKGHILEKCSQNYTTGAYPCLQMKFVLKRDIGYFLIQMYIPSMLIVILSWVSFWISADAIPARVSLGLLTVLTMTTQAAGSRSQLPKVSYIKAYDVWMSVCLVFVFASLLEFAVVNVFSRTKVLRSAVLAKQEKLGKTDAALTKEEVEYQRELKERKQQVLSVMDKRYGQKAEKQLKKMRYMRDPEGRAKAKKVDKLARKLFPCVFVGFNIVYWSSYILS